MATLISLQNVTKNYQIGDTPVPVLKDVNMEIEAGEFVAIMGASGSGKSTLLHLMGGLDRPSEGKVVIDGQDLSALDDTHLAHFRNKSIGFIFQNFFLLNYYTALENVCLPLVYAGMIKQKKSLAEQLLVYMGMEKRLHHRPNQLSGGEKQRTAIARALVNKPSIIFADEPTGSLDSKTGDAIMNLLGAIHQSGTAVVLITHDPHVAKQSQRVLRLSDGAFI